MKTTGSNAWVGDLLAWDTQDNKWTIINRDNIGTLSSDNSSCECGFDMDRYIPDAICVIPACHMSDGCGRWIALSDCNDETYRSKTINGYSSIQIGMYCYSSTNTVIQNLSNTSCITITTYDENKNTKTFGTKVLDKFNCGKQQQSSYLQVELGNIDILNPEYAQNNVRINPRTYKDIDNYDIIIDIAGKAQDYMSVSPWTYGDGTYEEGNSYGIKKYKEAFQTYCSDDEKLYNLMADFNGYENTQLALNYMKLNNNTKFEACCATSIYEPSKYSKGTWYLPASGEVCYLYARWYTIQLSLYKLYKMSNKPSTWPQSIVHMYCKTYGSILCSTLGGTTEKFITGGCTNDATQNWTVPLDYSNCEVRAFRKF